MPFFWSSVSSLLMYFFFWNIFQVICTKCKNISNRYDNMMDLTVEIHGDASSLEECLDQFTIKECLDGENKYKCDGYVSAFSLSVPFAIYYFLFQS